MADLSANARKPLTKLAFMLTSTASIVTAAAKLALPYTSALTSFRGIWVVAHLTILLVWKLSTNIREEGQQHEDDYLKPLVDVHDSIQNIPAVLEEPMVLDESVAEASMWPAKLTDDEVKEAMKPGNVVKEPIKGLSSIEEHDSIDDTWKAIMEGGASPVHRLLRKSETWECRTTAEALARQTPGEGRSELRKSATSREAGKGARGAEGTARQARIVRKPEMKKSATFREEKESGEGRRGREALVMESDELFGRVEAFIKTHHDHLRRQRQESVEQRRYSGLVSRAY